MRTKYILPILFIMLVAGGLNQVQGQQKVGTTSFQFLKIMPDAVGTGMGDAVTSLSTNSLAVFHNPAGLTSVDGSDFAFSMYDYFYDVKTSSASGAYSLGSLGILGFQVIYTDIGEIEVTDVSNLGFVDGVYNPGLTGGTFAPSSLTAGLSFARQLTDKFSFGVTAKFAQEDLGEAQASAMLFDGGLVYETGYRSIKTSAVIRNFGKDIVFINEAFPTPQTLVIGISADLFGPGKALLFSSEQQNLKVAFDIVGPRDYEQQYNMGLEWSYAQMLFIRSGYKSNYDSQGLSFGLGVKIKELRGDFSYASFGEYLPSVQRFSLGMALGK